MSQQINFNQPIDPQLLRNLVNQLKDPSQSTDGDGTNIFNFTLAAGAVNVKVLDRKDGRKSLTVINLDTVITVNVVKFVQTLLQIIPITPQGSVEFNPIKIGEFVQCLEGTELHQDIITCEFAGELRMSNPGAAPVNIVIVEAAF